MRTVVVGVLVEQQVLEMLEWCKRAAVQTWNTPSSSPRDVLDLSPEMKCLSFYSGNLYCKAVM